MDVRSTGPSAARSGRGTRRREIEAVVDVLRTSNLNLGPKVADCEAAVAVLLAKHHGVMVNSGSSALKLAVELLQLAPGD